MSADERREREMEGRKGKGTFRGLQGVGVGGATSTRAPRVAKPWGEAKHPRTAHRTAPHHARAVEVGDDTTVRVHGGDERRGWRVPVGGEGAADSQQTTRHHSPSPREGEGGPPAPCV